MRKKIIATLLFAFAISLTATAMTDKEVMATTIQLYQQGMDEMTIAKTLIKQGASVEQLQRIKSQLETEMKEKGSNGVTKAQNAQTNGRTNNGESAILVRQERENMQPREGKLIFGQDIFRKEEMSFEPLMNVPTPANYTLGAGDEVIIDIYGASQEQFKESISPDGNITISGYGPIHLAGLNVSEATRRLRNTLGSRYQSSQLMLTIGQTRSIHVNVMGEVAMPGSYQLSAFATAFHALYMAGGVAETGTLRTIKIYRANKQVATIDLYDFLMNGNTGSDTRLEDGDVILVGTYDELVEIKGKIKRPMYYELKQGETMDKLLYYAGGFSGDAYTDGIRVKRRAGGAQSVHSVRNDAFESFALMDGDKVQVDSILPRFKNTVSIRGAVFRGGQYGLSDNLKTVRQLIEAADGPTEHAFLNRGVLYRMKLDRTLIAVPIDLQAIIDGTAEDIELHNEDAVVIPSQYEKLSKQYVVIHGEVFRPDTFPYAENESVEDLILRAGGLTERASTSKVDVSRRVIDPKATDENSIKSQSYTVELHDNLAVTEHGFILEPFDEVYVRMSPAYGKQMNVSVRGEILFNGTYALKTQDDRLSDLVKAAGGLNSHAYAKGARLMRVMNEEERARRDQLIRHNKTASKDSVDMEKLDLETQYYVGIDLEAAIKNPGSNEDIILREGDVLIIPSQNTTVKINGEVLYPNTVSYISGKRAKYYINQAGGYSNNARRCKKYVIYANGKVAPASTAKIQPGSEIIVPSRPERKATNTAQWVAVSSATASLAGVIATITTLIVNSTKK